MKMDYVGKYIEYKLLENEEEIRITFYELRVKENLSEEQTEEFLQLCKNRVATLYNKVKKENEKKLIDVNMEVACGYVLYDKRIDYDIQDTVRRADKMMYKEKYNMKHGEAKE